MMSAGKIVDTLSITRQYFHGVVESEGRRAREASQKSDKNRIKTGRVARTDGVHHQNGEAAL
jgi:hypothetical protein